MTSLHHRYERLILVFTILLILGMSALVLLALKNPVSLDDGLRHFAMGDLIRMNGIGAADWQQWFAQGYFRDHPVDPWFLSDVIYAPLSILGARGAMVAFSLLTTSILLGSFLFAFRVMGVKPVAAALLLLVLVWFETNFSYRLLLGRPFALMTSMMVLMLAAVLGRRFWLACFVMILSVLISHLFVFPLAIAGLGVLWFLWLKQYRFAMGLIILVGLGTLVGLALHPYPLEYIHYLYTVFVRIPFLPVRLGGEMQSTPVALVMRSVTGITFVLFLFTTYLKRGHGHKSWQSDGTGFMFILTILCLGAFIVWSRAIDLLWPVVILSIGVLLVRDPALPQMVIDAITPKNTLTKRFAGIVIVGLCLSNYLGLFTVLRQTDEGRSLTVYAEGLKDVPAGAVILNPDWSFFAPAVAVRPDLTFTSGIDPSFTYVADPVAHDLFAMLQTPAFKDYTLVVNARMWLTSALSQYRADYLVLERKWNEAFIQKLLEELKVPDMTPEATFAVVKLKR